MSKAADYQPDPKQGQQEVAQHVLDDMRDRIEMGRDKYGNLLETFNGRNAMWDAYQETLDLAMYLRQELMEQESIETDEIVSAYDEMIKGFSHESIDFWDLVRERIFRKSLMGFVEALHEHIQLYKALVAKMERHMICADSFEDVLRWVEEE
jgi:hypothetical protein